MSERDIQEKEILPQTVAGGSQELSKSAARRFQAQLKEEKRIAILEEIVKNGIGESRTLRRDMKGL